MATTLAPPAPAVSPPDAARPVRTPQWWAKADEWADHLHAPWARCARRSADGVHGGYVTVQRPYWSAYDQIMINTDAWINFLVVDVDGADAVRRGWACPATPSWVVPTPHGAHVGWVLDSVKRDRRKASTYCAAVAENLRRVLDGDRDYAMRGTRNPLHVEHATQWGDLTPWGLRSLQNALASVWTTGVAPRGDGSTGDGRNVRLNTLLWREASAHPGTDLRTHAHLLNAMEDPPLDPREVDTIVRSVERGQAKRRRRSGGASVWSHDECVQGGKTRMAQPGAARSMNAASVESRRQKSNVLRKRALALREQGLSVRDVAQKVGVSGRTVQRWHAASLDLAPTPQPPLLPGGSK